MDALMGAERDVPEDLRKNVKLQFYDDEVDKLWLAGFSPHQALENTKNDLGPPPGQQETRWKNEWDALPQEEKDKYGFEFKLKEELEKLVEDFDRKIKRTKERIEVQNPLESLPPEVAQEVGLLDEQIRVLQEESGKLGEEGDVDQSLALHNEAGTLETKRADLVRSSSDPKQKQQFVCEVSGLIYSSTDNEQRIRDLQTGRQYIGWKKIRDHLVKLKAQNPPPGIPGYGRKSAAGGEGSEAKDRDRDRDRDHDSRRDSRRDDYRRDDRRDDRRDSRRDDRRDDRRDSRRDRDYRRDDRRY